VIIDKLDKLSFRVNLLLALFTGCFLLLLITLISLIIGKH